MPPEGQDAAATAGDMSDQVGADLTTAELGQEPQAREAADRSADADPGQADQAEMPGRDVGDALSPQTDRLKALETENDAARHKIAELEAELKTVKQEQAARLDRIEQQLAGADRHQKVRTNRSRARTRQVPHPVRMQRSPNARAPTKRPIQNVQTKQGPRGGGL